MRKIIFLVALATLPAMAQAGEKADEFCTSINGLAKSIMTARQSGVSLAQAIELAENEMIREIVIDAYERPRFNSDDLIQREVADFQDKWYLACIKQIN